MHPADIVEITTPQKYLLNGLWFGPTKPKRAIIWIHGLTSSAFSKLSIVEKLVDVDTAVLTFNNRGHDAVTRVSKRLANGESKSLMAGSAHEIFKDCVDDIQGAIDFAKQRGAKEIYLAGHSTGCQKSVYYAASKKCDPRVKGVILLAPVSDYSSTLKMFGLAKLNRAVKEARRLVKAGKPQELLSQKIWSDGIWSAQRFISLYTPDSAEEVFPYAQKEKVPTTLKKVRVPILVFWADADEYADMPTKSVVDWFSKHTRALDVHAVSDADHGFKGQEEQVAGIIKKWLT